MILPTFFHEPSTLLILAALTLIVLALLSLLCVYLNLDRIRRRKELNAAVEEKRLAYGNTTSNIGTKTAPPTNGFTFPLVKVSNPSFSETKIEPMTAVICETPPKSPFSSNYRTFDFGRRTQRHLSSDSSYTSSIPRYSASTSVPSDSIKSKFQQIQRYSSPSPTSYRQLETINSDQKSNHVSSDSDENNEEVFPTPMTPAFEYSLAEYFRIEMIYKLFYSIDDRQLLLQLIQFKSMQPMIERCFPFLICKIRLFTHNGKRKGKKYFSKKDSMNEVFKFDMDQYTLDQSYLKIQFFGQKKNEKRLELAQTILVLNQFENLTIRSQHHHENGLLHSPQHAKSIPIIEDRIELITQSQVGSPLFLVRSGISETNALSFLKDAAENEARALICLVYEDERCLLQVGVIKVTGLQSLTKLITDHHHHHRDGIQIKMLTMVDGKIIAKQKSKLFSLEKDLYSFSTSFHLDYLSLHKTSVCIHFYHRKSLIGSQGKLLSSIEFGSTQLKNQQSFQHWTDTLSAPNKPHVHWHTLQTTPMIKDK